MDLKHTHGAYQGVFIACTIATIQGLEENALVRSGYSEVRHFPPKT